MSARKKPIVAGKMNGRFDDRLMYRRKSRIGLIMKSFTNGGELYGGGLGRTSIKTGIKIK